MKTFRSLALLAGLAGVVSLPTFAADSRGEVNPEELKVRRYVPPVFPLTLRLEATMEGYAQVIMLLGADGRVTDSFASDYSDEAFAREAQRAVAEWQFDPSAQRRVCVRFDFRREGVVIMSTAAEALSQRMSMLAGNPNEVRSRVLSELDRTPQPLAISKPAFPTALAGTGKAGFVSVSFYIDETGAVRVPAVASAAEPQFGEAAVAAVTNWKFEPPQKNGRPTRVFVVQEFAFGAPKRTP